MTSAGSVFSRHDGSVVIACIVAASMMALGAMGSAASRNYPNKPVKIVINLPPGGPLYLTTRLLADKLSSRLKQTFIVEPRPGGNGNVGLNAVAKGPSDGYTLLSTLDYPLTINPFLYDRVPFDPMQDFKPISIVASFSQTLIVHPSVPVHSLAEFVTYAKARKDQPVIYDSGGGPGNPGHMTMEYFRLRAAFEGVHVPYNGNPEAVLGIASGQVQAGFLATAGVLPLIADGRVRALAISSLMRSTMAPDIPTVAESGFPGFDLTFYEVMLAPSGVPESVRALLEQEVRQALQYSDVQEQLRSQALEPMGSTGIEAAARLKAAAEQWRSVITATGIHLD